MKAHEKELNLPCSKGGKFHHTLKQLLILKPPNLQSSFCNPQSLISYIVLRKSYIPVILFLLCCFNSENP
jgi:hypothetical protein